MSTDDSQADARGRVLDNRRRTVADYLRPRLPGAAVFRLVSAYFSIYGYELLADELDRVSAVRFLFGDPGSVEHLDPGEKEPKAFVLTERGLAPTHTLQQKHLARRCAAWVRRGSVAIRSIRTSNFLHGKLYLADAPDAAAAVVGSSNFTRRGLGGGASANLEINLASTNPKTLNALHRWFDDLWTDDSSTRDVKQQVLDALQRLGRDHPPELIYYKTLYELFQADIDARGDANQQLEDTHLHDTAVWNALYEFQKDGASSVITRLQRHNGCILADSVGLGKTYTALAVIKYYELRNQRVLVLCPKKLRQNWALYQAHTGQRHNPFLDDRFGYTLLSHTDLSRQSGFAEDVDLAAFNWSGYDLIVIDESHNFRNSEGQRYQRLIDDVIKQGVATKVLLLSATPVNTSLTDLRNQLYLMTEGREDSFRQSLGVGNIGALMAAAQREFKQWENRTPPSSGQRDKGELLERLGADFLRLLEGVSISRSRRHVEQFYPQEMQRVGQFPAHEAPVNRHPPTDLDDTLSYKELADQIGAFALSVYRPSAYLVSESRLRELDDERERRNFDQRDRERWLTAMLRTNFLKRLESSPHSLTLTLERTLKKIDDLLDRIARFQDGRAARGARADERPDDDDDDEDLIVNRTRYPYRLDELDLPRWTDDLQRDKATLTAVWERVRVITPNRDGKLQQLARDLRDKAQNPPRDQDGQPNRKLLVFTTFKDTANYLYENLHGLAAELGLATACVSGDAAQTDRGRNDYNEILSRFAPAARAHSADDGSEIDLLIATDCISEGQNLQDCDTVVNYDIHWNPVRIIQRFGRVDRIGSRSRTVRMINYWPTDDMEVYLDLRNRVLARMALADLSASGDDDPFTEDQAQLELRFRDEQLRKLRLEILDLDDLSDGVVMSDFTLDHFFAQLLRYLETNRAQLEATPTGAYALTPASPPSPPSPSQDSRLEAAVGVPASPPSPSQSSSPSPLQGEGRGEGSSPSKPTPQHPPARRAAPPGVIFFLRQRNAAADLQHKPVSPVHPFYLVYVHANGHIRHGAANARQALTIFETAAAGRAKPLPDLCDWFDRTTTQGTDMTRYDKLLRSVAAHVRQAHAREQTRNLGSGGPRDFILPKASETPGALDDFELVTWLIIAPPAAADAA